MQQVRGRGNLQAGGDIFFHHNDFNEERRIKEYTDNRHVYSVMRIQVIQITLLILVLLLSVTNFVRHASLQVEVKSLQEEVKELKSISILLLNRHPSESKPKE